MEKLFDAWNIIKKRLHNRLSGPYAYQREIWWCAIGINIGAEIDGKDEQFQRPVIVMRVYNKDTLLVLPLTNKERHDRFHHKISAPSKPVWAVLTQLRVISNRRLVRKIESISMEQFQLLRNAMDLFL